MMKRLFLCCLLALPLAAAERAAFGVLAVDVEPQIHNFLPVDKGALVDSVCPGSPAAKAGIRPGAVITAIGSDSVSGRASLAAALEKHQPGDSVRVSLFADGSPRTVTVKLVRRPQQESSSPDKAVGADRVMRPVAVSEAIRVSMKMHRTAICAQLSRLPEPFDPPRMTENLQAIRHLARDANAADSSWMFGEAGESAVQFKDAEGSIQLRGANKSLTLEVFDKKGNCTFNGKLDTAKQRRAIPAEVLERLRKLK